MSSETLVVDLIFRSASGASLSSVSPAEDLDLEAYEAAPETGERALEALREMGFEIVGAATAFGVSISGSPALVQTVFGEGELAVPESLEEWIDSARLPPSGDFFSP